MNAPYHFPAESYADILRRDTRAVPIHLYEGNVPDIGTDPVSTSHYHDPAFFKLEVEKVWKRIWQLACREEELPSPGDYQVYDIADRSLIIARGQDGAIRAFHNSCLHRGRKLATAPGCKNSFKCPFHGMAWSTEGELQSNPLEWDFPQWKHRDLSLPQARVETWGGFVFVNFDAQAQPLAKSLGPIPEHFRAYGLAERYKAVHVAKVVRANWKVVAEAFMESHHTVTTHPQLLPFLADVNSQYDLLTDLVSRQFSAAAVPSPFIAEKNLSASDIISAMAGSAGRGQIEVPQNVSARAFAAELARRRFGAEDGWSYERCSDAEMLDPMLYNLWPNMSFWAGFPPTLIYRWRPNGLDPDSSIMDVMILKRVPKDAPRPRPATVKRLGADESWTAAAELGPLANVFEQDMGNLPYVQEGLRASATGKVHFGRYSEMRLRQLHHVLDRYIEQP